MEEIIFIILQFLGECLFEAVLSLIFSPSERKAQKLAAKRSESATSDGWYYARSAAIGVILAALSLIPFGNTVINRPLMRVVNLVAAPLLAAYLAESVAELRQKNSPDISPTREFWRAFAFTAGFVLVRFIWATPT
jgi:hypothetical protein